MCITDSLSRENYRYIRGKTFYARAQNWRGHLKKVVFVRNKSGAMKAILAHPKINSKACVLIKNTLRIFDKNTKSENGQNLDYHDKCYVKSLFAPNSVFINTIRELQFGEFDESLVNNIRLEKVQDKKNVLSLDYHRDKRLVTPE